MLAFRSEQGFTCSGCSGLILSKSTAASLPRSKLVAVLSKELEDGKTETECFINHTHLLDKFRNGATSERRDAVSHDFEVVEEAYDVNHPDFVGACELGKQIARMWATKLKSDFPLDRFRVYYTQYDNPIVRFHKVRENETVWLDDDALRLATDRSFTSAVIYDTDYLDRPVIKKQMVPC